MFKFIWKILYLQFAIYLFKVQAETMVGLGEKTVLEVLTPAQSMFEKTFFFEFPKYRNGSKEM